MAQQATRTDPGYGPSGRGSEYEPKKLNIRVQGDPLTYGIGITGPGTYKFRGIPIEISPQAYKGMPRTHLISLKQGETPDLGLGKSDLTLSDTDKNLLKSNYTLIQDFIDKPQQVQNVILTPEEVRGREQQAQIEAQQKFAEQYGLSLGTMTTTNKQRIEQAVQLANQLSEKAKADISNKSFSVAVGTMSLSDKQRLAQAVKLADKVFTTKEEKKAFAEIISPSRAKDQFKRIVLENTMRFNQKYNRVQGTVMPTPTQRVNEAIKLIDKTFSPQAKVEVMSYLAKKIKEQYEIEKEVYRKPEAQGALGGEAATIEQQRNILRYLITKTGKTSHQDVKNIFRLMGLAGLTLASQALGFIKGPLDLPKAIGLIVKNPKSLITLGASASRSLFGLKNVFKLNPLEMGIIVGTNVFLITRAVKAAKAAKTLYKQTVIDPKKPVKIRFAGEQRKLGYEIPITTKKGGKTIIKFKEPIVTDLIFEVDGKPVGVAVGVTVSTGKTAKTVTVGKGGVTLEEFLKGKLNMKGGQFFISGEKALIKKLDDLTPALEKLLSKDIKGTGLKVTRNIKDLADVQKAAQVSTGKVKTFSLKDLKAKKIKTDDFVNVANILTEDDISRITGMAITSKDKITEFSGIIKGIKKVSENLDPRTAQQYNQALKKVIDTVVASVEAQKKIKGVSKATKIAVGTQIALSKIKTPTPTKATTKAVSITPPRSKKVAAKPTLQLTQEQARELVILAKDIYKKPKKFVGPKNTPTSVKLTPTQAKELVELTKKIYTTKFKVPTKQVWSGKLTPTQTKELIQLSQKIYKKFKAPTKQIWDGKLTTKEAKELVALSKKIYNTKFKAPKRQVWSGTLTPPQAKELINLAKDIYVRKFVAPKKKVWSGKLTKTQTRQLVKLAKDIYKRSYSVTLTIALLNKKAKTLKKQKPTPKAKGKSPQKKRASSKAKSSARSRSVISVKSKPLSKSKGGTKGRAGVSSRVRSRAKSKVKPTISTGTGSKSRSKVRIKQKVTQAQRSNQKQKQKMKSTQKQQAKSLPAVSTAPKPPKVKPPKKFPHSKKKTTKKTTTKKPRTGYYVYEKQGKRFVRLKGKPLKKEQALDKLAHRIDNKTSRTAKIVPVKNVKSFGTLPKTQKGYYNKYKKNLRNYRIVKGKRVYTPNVFIEKKGKPLISTRGEKRQLQLNRQAKSKRKPKTSLTTSQRKTRSTRSRKPSKNSRRPSPKRSSSRSKKKTYVASSRPKRTTYKKKQIVRSKPRRKRVDAYYKKVGNKRVKVNSYLRR